MNDTATDAAPAAPETIMTRLKSATDDHHRRAEGKALQQNLFKGILPRETYAAYLAELRRIHGALEQRLEELASEQDTLAGVYRTQYARSQDLDADLAFFGHRERDATPAAEALLADIDHWAEESPAALLGALYVLEGSMNGNKFIARVLMKAWSLAPGPGLRYLMPYGEKQPAIWAQFKADMDAQDLSADDEGAIIASAQRTFDAISDIADAVYAA